MQLIDDNLGAPILHILLDLGVICSPKPELDGNGKNYPW